MLKVYKTYSKTYEVESTHLYSNYGDIEDRANQIGRPLENRGFSKCFICGHKFDRAEDAYIAHVKNHKNVFLCKGCANVVQAEEGE